MNAISVYYEGIDKHGIKKIGYVFFYDQDFKKLVKERICRDLKITNVKIAGCGDAVEVVDDSKLSKIVEKMEVVADE